MTPLRLAAPAKLNLWLRVVGRRPDGYHELESELVLLDLADDLLLMSGCSGLRVESEEAEPIPTTVAENLAWRGLIAGLGREPQLECLLLRKRIPSAAGLGGGSSDAAAGWRLARRAVGLDEPISEADLGRLAGLGADVPFFATATASARVSGIGERVSPLPEPAADRVVLIDPGFRLSTAAVFAELREADWGADHARNDLLAPALRLRPELADLQGRIATAGGEPRLTGSGSFLFVQTPDGERASAIAAAVRRMGLRVTETRVRTEAARIETLSEDVEES